MQRNVLLPKGWKIECPRCCNLPKEFKDIDKKGPEVWSNVFSFVFNKINRLELTAQNNLDWLKERICKTSEEARQCTAQYKNISDKLEEIDYYYKMLLRGVIDYYTNERKRLEEDIRDLTRTLKHHGLQGYRLSRDACCCKQE